MGSAFRTPAHRFGPRVPQIITTPIQMHCRTTIDHENLRRPERARRRRSRSGRTEIAPKLRRTRMRLVTRSSRLRRARRINRSRLRLHSHFTRNTGDDRPRPMHPTQMEARDDCAPPQDNATDLEPTQLNSQLRHGAPANCRPITTDLGPDARRTCLQDSSPDSARSDANY